MRFVSKRQNGDLKPENHNLGLTLMKERGEQLQRLPDRVIRVYGLKELDNKWSQIQSVISAKVRSIRNDTL